VVIEQYLILVFGERDAVNKCRLIIKTLPVVNLGHETKQSCYCSSLADLIKASELKSRSSAGTAF
jgi:hypothetical protein